MKTPPPPPAESPWARGSRTVRQAMAETGLSRQELWQLMTDGVVPYFVHGAYANSRRLLSWKCLVEYLESLHKEHVAGAVTERTA